MAYLNHTLELNPNQKNCRGCSEPLSRSDGYPFCCYNCRHNYDKRAARKLKILQRIASALCHQLPPGVQAWDENVPCAKCGRVFKLVEPREIAISGTAAAATCGGDSLKF